MTPVVRISASTGSRATALQQRGAETFVFTVEEGKAAMTAEDVPALTNVETDLIDAALGPAPQRWDGEAGCCAARVHRRRAPGRLWPNRCAPARSRGRHARLWWRRVRFLLERGVALDAGPTVYNVLHEAAWAGATDTLQAVFESGASDATPVSVRKPHTGWPDNVSLMYRAAWGGYPDLARTADRTRGRGAPRTRDQGQRRARYDVAARGRRAGPLGRRQPLGGWQARSGAHPH